MTLLMLIIVWFALSPVLALACGAFIKAGRCPHLDPSLRLLPGHEAGTATAPGLRADSAPGEDLAA